MQAYLMVGEVLKPQGVRGECKIKSFAADINKFKEWKELYLKNESGYNAVKFDLVRIHDGFVYAILNECAAMSEAEKYRSAKLYIDRQHATSLEDGAAYIADLVGCTAYDEKGESLGTLSDVLQHGPVDTWVFKNNARTWMAPALKIVFTDVDVAGGRIYVQSDKLEEVAVFED